MNDELHFAAERGAAHLSKELKQLQAQDRNQLVVRKRGLLMAALRRHFKVMDVARELQKDHSTVLSAVRNVLEEVRKNKKVAAQYRALCAEVDSTLTNNTRGRVLTMIEELGTISERVAQLQQLLLDELIHNREETNDERKG